MFKCKFVGADARVPNELRIYYTLLDVNWVKAFVMEVYMSISGFCIYASVYIGAVKYIYNILLVTLLPKVLHKKLKHTAMIIRQKKNNPIIIAVCLKTAYVKPLETV